eukprot:7132713-Ditylum_brightwellii.AAC.1
MEYIVMNKFSFTKAFIDSLVANTPTDIDKQMKNNLVQVIKNAEKNYVKTITPINDEEVLKFQATLGCPVQRKCKGEENCAFSNIANLKEWYTSGRDLVNDHLAQHDNWSEMMNLQIFIGCQMLHFKF